MARKAKTAKQAKPADNGIGHNGGGEITDEDTQRLFFIHKRTYQAKLASKKAADADLKNACKQFVSDLGAHAVRDIKVAVALESDDGDAELRAEIEAKLRVARWMGASAGTQFEFFGDEDRTPAVDRARADGKRHGLSGDPCRPMCDPSTPQYQSYMEGFHEGQDALAGIGIRPLDEQHAGA